MDSTVAISSNWEERKAEGWEWMENHNSRNEFSEFSVGQSNYQRIKQLEEKYGDKNVCTGNAAEDVNGSPYPIGIPGQYGVYVRRET